MIRVTDGNRKSTDASKYHDRRGMLEGRDF